MIEVRHAQPGDEDTWLRLRCQLWPDGSRAEHAAEIASYFDARAKAPLAVLLAFDSAQRAVGLAELSIRWCAEGCQSDHVTYLEGWYVVPEARRSGVGRALMAAAVDWGRSQGSAELASDADAANDVSARAHVALGFQDVGLIRCFCKAL